jgi:hypothetical protein
LWRTGLQRTAVYKESTLMRYESLLVMVTNKTMQAQSNFLIVSMRSSWIF